MRSFVEAKVGVGSSFMPSSTLVIQGENAHDIVTLVASSETLGRVRETTPVSVRWGHLHGSEQTFYGYVHHVEPIYTGDNPLGRHKLVCIGASWALTWGLQRAWRYQSLDTIVREVAQWAYLSADVEPHPVIWPYTASNSSGWDFLLGLAAKIGYTLSANGTELKFISVAEAIRRGLPTAPIINPAVFHPVVGAGSDAGHRSRRLGYGLDPRTARVFSVSQGDMSDPLELDTTVVGDNPEEAQLQLAQHPRFLYQAKAETAGNARITQGSLVYIDRVDYDYAGHWYVHRVEHDIRTDGDYTAYLQLGKDSRGAYAPAAPEGKGMRLRTDPYGEVTGTPPPSVLVNGRWRSGWARRAS